MFSSLCLKGNQKSTAFSTFKNLNTGNFWNFGELFGRHTTLKVLWCCYIIGNIFTRNVVNILPKYISNYDRILID